MAQVKKIVGLSTGRINGNCEILLKEALTAAEEMGITSEIIRAMELDVKPCKGCEACTIAMGQGKEARCVLKDDVPWILDKILVEDCALIVSVPLYHLRPNAYFEAIHERMLPTMFRNPQITDKTRVGAIISVGGGEPEWTPLGLTSINIFMQHTRKLVDQMQTNFVTRPGAVLMEPGYLERARRLGQNLARAILMPIGDVKYAGEDTEASCPVCHGNVWKVPDSLTDIYCPVCWVHGTLSSNDDGLKVIWDEEDVQNPRFSSKFIGQHLELIAGLHKKFFTEDIETVKERIRKYADYGNIVKP
jgi:multimeric flavodoxin WrbA